MLQPGPIRLALQVEDYGFRFGGRHLLGQRRLAALPRTANGNGWMHAPPPRDLPEGPAPLYHGRILAQARWGEARNAACAHAPG